MKKKFLVLFLLTLLLSIALRTYLLTQNPEGFDQTEAAFGYNAYSVLRTGRDEYGKFLPLVLVSIGDYKLSGYTFWHIPFIAVLGLNEFSTRLSTATSGIISLLLVYYITYQLCKSRKIALLTFFFTSIAPWHLILSRMAYDPMIAFMFYLASLALFIKWYQTKGRLFFLLFSAFALCWSIMTYYAVWVILPFTLLFYGICIYKKSQGKKRVYAALIMLLPVLLFAKLLLITQGQRLYQDSTYQVHARPLLEEQIREDKQEFPLTVTRAFHNKAVFYPQFLLQNLFNNLSFDFLFLRGDKLDRRFSVPFHGVLYLWSAPFILLGALYFWKHHSLYKNALILGSIVVVFLGSSFSEFGSETERTLFVVPLFSFLMSYGLLVIYTYFQIHARFILPFIVGSSLPLVFNIAYFNHQYYWHANVHEPWGRDFGMREMITSLPSLEEKYKKIIIPDYSYIFYYFYYKIDPKIAWEESSYRLNKSNFLGLHLRAKIGNYLSMPIECPAAGKLHALYVCRGRKIPQNSNLIKVIRYRDDQPAFVLLEFTHTDSTQPAPKNMEYMEKSGIINDNEDVWWKTESEI